VTSTPMTNALRPFLVAAAAFLACAGCLPPSTPSPQPEPVTIVGEVRLVEGTADAIYLEEPVQGFRVVVITRETRIYSSEGQEVDLEAIPPQATLWASGHRTETGTLQADEIRLMTSQLGHLSSNPIPTSATELKGYTNPNRRPGAGPSGILDGGARAGSLVSL